MSNIEPKCSYPECGPTCRRDCPPLPANPIEPTEEQKQAAREWIALDLDMRHGVRHIARLLAEREAKLREEYRRQLGEFNDDVARAVTRAVEGPDEWAMGDDVLRPALQKVIDAKVATIAARYKHQHENDTLRARVAELERPNWLTTPTRSTRSRKDRLKEAREREETLRARVAELEAKIADAVFSCPGCGRHDFGFFASQIKAACGPCRTRAEVAEAREAQHLADIKALMGSCSVAMDAIDDDDTVAARNELSEATERLAHYDDAKADAPASTEGGEG